MTSLRPISSCRSPTFSSTPTTPSMATCELLEGEITAENGQCWGSSVPLGAAEPPAVTTSIGTWNQSSPVGKNVTEVGAFSGRSLKVNNSSKVVVDATGRDVCLLAPTSRSGRASSSSTATNGSMLHGRVGRERPAARWASTSTRAPARASPRRRSSRSPSSGTTPSSSRPGRSPASKINSSGVIE